MLVFVVELNYFIYIMKCSLAFVSFIEKICISVFGILEIRLLDI